MKAKLPRLLATLMLRLTQPSFQDSLPQLKPQLSGIGQP